MRSIISGLIGGLIAAIVTIYISKAVGRTEKYGELRFGKFMWILATACLLMASLPAAATLLAGHNKEFWAKVLLTAGFGVGALYCFGEAAFVKGNFDSEGIRFSSPWTGEKSAGWRELESVQENDWCNWYTLTFNGGVVIRLSKYLTGHMDALDAAAEWVRSNTSLERTREG